MSMPPSEYGHSEDPESMDCGTFEFAALISAMEHYEDTQNKYIGAVVKALHSTDLSSTSRQPLLDVSDAIERYIMGFDDILGAIVEGDNTTDDKLAEISGIIKHDAERWNDFKKEVLSDTDPDDEDDDDAYIGFDLDACVEDLQRDLEELDDLSQLQTTLVNGFADDLEHQYSKLLVKYMEQQAR